MIETKIKDTQVGRIPEDWIIGPLSDFCTRITDGSHDSPPETKTGFYMPSVKDMTTHGFDFSNCKKISYENYVRLCRNGCNPEIGDVLIAKDGSILKYSFCIEKELPIVILSSIAIIKPKHDFVDGKYLAYYFSKPDFVHEVISNYKTGTGVPRIVLKNFAQIFISFPENISEQKHIAKSLSNIDALISILSKQIEKKKAIKQGTMQLLLSGKSRLKEHVNSNLNCKNSQVGMIPKEWNVCRIKDLTDIVTGATPSTAVPDYWKDGTIKWMSSGELNNKFIYDVQGRITSRGYDNSGTHMIPKYCVLIGLAGQGKTRGTAAYNLVELCTNQSIAAILPNNKLFDSLYLYFYMDSQYQKLRELSAGDGGRGGLNKKLLLNFFIPLPPIEEQTAIASVLSSMDKEISTLEAKRDKYIAIKNGMMQQLLTGKIRLL